MPSGCQISLMRDLHALRTLTHLFFSSPKSFSRPSPHLWAKSRSFPQWVVSSQWTLSTLLHNQIKQLPMDGFRPPKQLDSGIERLKVGFQVCSQNNFIRLCPLLLSTYLLKFIRQTYFRIACNFCSFCNFYI